MADDRKLELRTTEDGEVHAVITLMGDMVMIDGEETARKIIDSWARQLGSDADAFEYLWRNGWSNGPVALYPLGSKRD